MNGSSGPVAPTTAGVGASAASANSGAATTQQAAAAPSSAPRSRRPSVDTSDSDDDTSHKYSRQNTRTGAAPPGDPTASGASSAADRKLNRKEKRALKSKHRKINKKHPEFELTYDMMLGIRTVVGNNLTGHVLTAAPSSSDSAADLRRKEQEAAARRAKVGNQMLKLTFPGKGSSHTPAHAMRDFKFKDYSADVFRKIRDRFQIDPTEYLLSVCGNFQYLEFISNSKSGQFFFYSHDRQYMIKTISGGECKFLRSILPEYLAHIESNPHTLLTRYYGMHRIKPHKKREVHFLIMGSVFHTSKFVHTVFDLKGSRQGRNATQKEKESGAPVYKDNDFLDMNIKISLGEERAKLLNAQIAADVDFLSQLNIMDYSLLLGIHYKDRAGEMYGPGDATTNAVRNASTDLDGMAVAREGLAGATGDLATAAGDAFELLRVQNDPLHAQQPEDEPTHADDRGGIYTQLHPKNRPAREEETSHLDPHPDPHNGLMPEDLIPQTPSHRQHNLQVTSPQGNSLAVPVHSQENTTATLPTTPVVAPVAAPVSTSSPPPSQPQPQQPQQPAVTTTVGETENEDTTDLPMIKFHFDDPFTPRRGPRTLTIGGPGSAATLPSPRETGSGWNDQPPRVNRSHSLVQPHSPLTAAALHSQAEAARTKKELDALAKLDAIARQTAYGLPRKYNKVSKPGDIAFPFEFQFDDELAPSQPNSPVHAHAHAAAAAQNGAVITARNSPLLGAALPGPHSALDSLSPPAQPARTPSRATADSSPVAASAGAAPVTPSPVDDAGLTPRTGWELPPPIFTPATPATEAATQSGGTHAALTPLPPRALSVFASPNSREAQSFATYRDRGFSFAGGGAAQRSILQSPGPAAPTNHAVGTETPQLGAFSMAASASTVAATHVRASPRTLTTSPALPIDIVGTPQSHTLARSHASHAAAPESTPEEHKSPLAETAAAAAVAHTQQHANATSDKDTKNANEAEGHGAHTTTTDSDPSVIQQAPLARSRLSHLRLTSLSCCLSLPSLFLSSAVSASSPPTAVAPVTLPTAVPAMRSTSWASSTF